MFVDCSKWDALTLISWMNEDDLVEEVKKHVAPPAAKKCSTRRTRQANEKSDDKLMLMNSCDSCERMMLHTELQACSRCHVRSYCSRDCQRLDWEKKHKQECKPRPASITKATIARTDRSLKMLLAILEKHSGEIFFGCVEGEDNADTLSMLARSFQHSRGSPGTKALLLMELATVVEVEKLAVDLSMLLQGSRSDRPFFLKGRHISWSPGKLESISKDMPAFKRIDNMMSKASRDQFGLMAVITEANETWMGTTLEYVCDQTPKERLNKTPSPAPFPASKSAFGFARRLETHPAYARCRKAMFQIQRRRSGILWLRNISTKGDGYDRRELTKMITPKSLLQSLKSSDQAAVQFAILGTDQNTFTCPFVTAAWPSILEVRSREVSDPNVVLGMFVTYLNSYTSNFIVTEFLIR